MCDVCMIRRRRRLPFVSLISLCARVCFESLKFESRALEREKIGANFALSFSHKHQPTQTQINERTKFASSGLSFVAFKFEAKKCDSSSNELTWAALSWCCCCYCWSIILYFESGIENLFASFLCVCKLAKHYGFSEMTADTFTIISCLVVVGNIHSNHNSHFGFLALISRQAERLCII